MDTAVANYKKAYADWQVKYDSHMKAKRESQETGEAFVCVEPPTKPKFEDFIAGSNSSYGGSAVVNDYRNAHADWETRYNSHMNAKREAKETGKAFICVEPPARPKFEDFIDNDGGPMAYNS